MKRKTATGALAVQQQQQQQQQQPPLLALSAALGRGRGRATLPIQSIAVAGATSSVAAAAAVSQHHQQQQHAAAPSSPLGVGVASDIINRYNLMCEVGEGTYGVVYKAELRSSDGSSASASSQPQQKRSRSTMPAVQSSQQVSPTGPMSAAAAAAAPLPSSSKVAIKKFRATKDGEGISLTACREIGLLKELEHDNVLRLQDVILNPREKSLFLVFDYCEFDLFGIIKHHRDKGIAAPEVLIKSCMWQILNGINYLHANWVIHRDIKPSNILVMGHDSMSPGRVKIGDFGLARIFQAPLRPLCDNGVVVTIWYRAPEILLMSKHYTPAIDIWAIGCIFAELMVPRPLFQGKEKNQNDPTLFQDDQVEKIFRVLGTPQPDQFPFITQLPKWPEVQGWPVYTNVLGRMFSKIDPNALDLLARMLYYDPMRRISASDALEHPYFKTAPLPVENIFAASQIHYPLRQPIPQSSGRVKH